MQKLILVVAFSLLASPAFAAASPEAKCQAAKNRAAGAYARCLQDAAAKRALTGDDAKHQEAVDRCAAAFDAQFAKAETAAAKKGVACPTEDDAAGVDAWVAGHAETLAEGLAPGGALPTCGDGVVNAIGEQCDTADLGGATCVELGEPAGPLGCTASCRFDVSTCATPCQDAGGVDVAGACWFIAEGYSSSCNTVCSAKGLACNEAVTRDHAGSGGSLASCQSLVDALMPATAPHAGTEADLDFCGSELAIGCAFSPGMGGPIGMPAAALRVTLPATTCAATGQGGGCGSGNRRACACD